MTTRKQAELIRRVMNPTARERAEEALPHYLHMCRRINLAAIDAAIHDARQSGVHADRVKHADSARERCIELFIAADGTATESAEFQRAMDAGQTLFEVAQQLIDLTQLRPEVKRDRARQAGTSKPRGSRMPQLDAWLDGKLAGGDQSNDVLWAEIPDSSSDSDLYRDGNSIAEVSAKGKEHKVKRDGFDTRVTEARKRVSAVSN